MIPFSSDQIRRWTPDTLVNMPVPPVFLFRPTTWRDKGRMQDMLMAEGLTFHDNESIDAELLRALKALWSPAEDFERVSTLLVEAVEATRAGIPIDGRKAQEAQNLIDLVRENWPRYNKMLAQNAAFFRDWPRIVMSMMIVGWEGLKTPFRREAGSASMDCIMAMSAELEELDREAIEKGLDGAGEPGSSFLLLGSEVVAHMGLTDDQRKNSSPESQSAGTPDGSSTDGTATPAGEKSGETESKSSSGSGSRPTKPRSRKA